MSFARRTGVDKDHLEGSLASFRSSAAPNAVISDPRNPFVFASCFPWRSTPSWRPLHSGPKTKCELVDVFYRGAVIWACREAFPAKNGLAGSPRIDDRAPSRASGPAE
jgi:hypothetical protein